MIRTQSPALRRIYQLATQIEPKRHQRADENAMPDVPSSPLPTSATARAIIEAGKKARGEIDIDPRPTGLAKLIINAGRRARGEEPLA